MNNIFLQFAVVLGTACSIGFLMYRLKLPLVAAYLITGVVLSAVSLWDTHSLGIFTFLPDLGIAFVLFLIGMELDLREIRALGRPVFIASLGQILISALAGFAIAGSLGFSHASSIYFGFGLSFSSTVVVIKLLLEKRDLTSLYGKLSVGILLIEDVVAILALMMLSIGPSVFNLSMSNSLPLIMMIVKAAGLFLLTFILSKYFLEKIFDNVAKSAELLFLTAITWCFVFTSVAVLSGFSVVIGAFLAGVALASSPYHLQIQGKIKPLRDFFVTMFFVFLGTQVKLPDIVNGWPLVLLLTSYALVVKPVVFLLILGTFGFKKHTLFQTALNLSQISEFSLVIMLLGVREGMVPQSMLSIMAAVAVLSIVFSSVLITYSKKVYKVVSPLISFFVPSGKVHFFETNLEQVLNEHVIVIGAHRIGGPVVDFFKKEKIPFVVVDFNPHVVENLRSRGINVIFGDAGDPEILDNLGLERAKLIISTASEITDNEILLGECRRRRIEAKIVSRAIDPSHAQILKKLGADFVILPEVVTGDYLVSQLKNHWPKVHFSALD